VPRECVPAHERTGTIGQYEIMLILNPEAAEEQQEEILERVQQLVRDGDGTIDHVNDWGRRKLSYPFDKRPEGRYVVLTCSAAGESLAEIERVVGISKDVVLRAMTVRLNRVDAERAMANGAPVPVDDRPEGESRPPRGQRPGGRGGGRGRR